MSDPSGPPDDPKLQLKQHLDSLRAAGVEWLPHAPLTIPPAQAVEPVPSSASRPTSPASAPSGSVPARPTPVVPQTVQTGLFGAGPALVEPAEGSGEGRRHELTVLAQQVAECRRCPELAATRRQTVFGVGPLDADLCFVGEAPGRDEDQQGEPFVGAAGQLLDRIIAACGMKRQEVFICNILRCRPPNNRTPTAEEAAHCNEYLERTLELVRPKFLVVLGGTAATYLLGTTVGITRLRGKWFDYTLPDGTRIPTMPLYHPAYLLRTPGGKRQAWMDLIAVAKRLEALAGTAGVSPAS
jgi:uracil-DNA glycosylase family 4